MTTKLKINGVPKDYPSLPFGRQLEYRHVIADFKATAKSTHVSQKRQSSTKALRDAIKLYEMAEYFCQFHDDQLKRDDGYEIWYKKKE